MNHLRLLLLMVALPGLVVAQERVSAEDSNKNANEINSIKETKVSSTLTKFEAGIDPRLQLLITCGNEGAFANWSTKSCVFY